ncbi:MAG: hypothetical protein ACR2K2_10860 [Mycobacteriales bacterium]
MRSRARPTDRVLTWTADVDRIDPGSPQWQAVAPLVRLNAGATDLPARWEKHSRMLRLTPAPVGTD